MKKNKTVPLIWVVTSWAVIWLGLYIMNFYKLPISNDPEPWAHFSTFFSGVIIGPLTFAASGIAAWFVYKTLEIERKNYRKNVAIIEVDSYKDKLLRFKEAFDEKINLRVNNKNFHNELEGKKIVEILQAYAHTTRVLTNEEEQEMLKLAHSILGSVNVLVQCAYTYSHMMNHKIIETEDEKEAHVCTEYFIWYNRYSILALNLIKICEPNKIEENEYFQCLFVLETDNENHFIKKSLSS